MAWTNTATAKAKIKAALVTELQGVIDDIEPDRGSSTTNGETGRECTLTASQPDTDYTPIITFTGNPGPNVGHVWVTKATTKITVYNVGDTGIAFDWAIVRRRV